jgi:hypothetical protein
MLEFLQAMAGLAWRQRADRLMERVTDLLPGALASHGYDFESLAETTESARDVHFTFDRNPDRSAKDKVMLRPAILHNGALIKRGTVLTPREWPAAEPAKQDEAG